MQSRNDDQEFMANLSSMKRAKEALRLASIVVRRERKVAKLEHKKKKELGALYVPPEPRSRSCSPVKGRRRKNRSDESSSSDSETEDKEEEMQDN